MAAAPPPTSSPAPTPGIGREPNSPLPPCLHLVLRPFGFSLACWRCIPAAIAHQQISDRHPPALFQPLGFCCSVGASSLLLLISRSPTATRLHLFNLWGFAALSVHPRCYCSSADLRPPPACIFSTFGALLLRRCILAAIAHQQISDRHLPARQCIYRSCCPEQMFGRQQCSKLGSRHAVAVQVKSTGHSKQNMRHAHISAREVLVRRDAQRQQSSFILELERCATCTAASPGCSASAGGSAAGVYSGHARGTHRGMVGLQRAPPAAAELWRPRSARPRSPQRRSRPAGPTCAARPARSVRSPGPLPC